MNQRTGDVVSLATVRQAEGNEKEKHLTDYQRNQLRCENVRLELNRVGFDFNGWVERPSLMTMTHTWVSLMWPVSNRPLALIPGRLAPALLGDNWNANEVERVNTAAFAGRRPIQFCFRHTHLAD